LQSFFIFYLSDYQGFTETPEKNFLKIGLFKQRFYMALPISDLRRRGGGLGT